jgi:hypothetical protein
MISQKTDTNVLVITTIIITAAMIATGGYVGADVNWDLRSYHIYGGYRWLHNGYNHDMFAAQIQSFLNPTLDAFIVALMELLPPRGVAIVLATMQSLSAPFIAQIIRRTLLPGLQDMPPAYRWPAIVAVMAAAMTGAMTLSQIGTSYGDLLVAVPMLFSVMCLCEIATQQTIRNNTLCFVGTGFGAGLAVGLKMTNLVFIPAFILGLCLQKKPWAERWNLLVVFCAVYIIGWACTGGLWAWKLWDETGSPLFPFFNGLFQSTLIDPVTINVDPRFSAKSIIDAVVFPFTTALGDHPGAEPAFADSRIALFVLALPFLVWKGWRQWPFQFTLLLTVSYGVWIFAFGVQRYALILEMLSCVAVALALTRIPHPVSRALAIILVAILTIATTSYPNWNNRIAWNSIGDHGNWLNVRAPDILTAPNTMFILLGDQPTAYVMPQLNPENAFIRIGGNFRLSPDSRLWHQRSMRIAQHTGSLYTIGHWEPTEDEAMFLHSTGWIRTNETCLPIVTAVEILLACRMQHFAQG